MEPQKATDVRNGWSEFFDSVIRGRPQAVKRNRDIAMVLAFPHLKEILAAYRFTVEYWLSETDEDGTYCGSLKEIEHILWYGNTLDELKTALAKDLIEYAKDYLNDFSRYYNAPNLRAHFPYVLRVSLMDTIEEVESLIDICQPGKN